MMSRLTLLALAAMAAPAVHAQGWSHAFRDFPAEAMEGKVVRLKVAYTAPEPVKLHVELKDTSNVVHVGAVQEVTGTGVAQFAMMVPVGKFDGQMLAAVWMGEDWREPKAAIVHAGPIPVYTVEEGRRLQEATKRGAALRKRLGLDARRPVVAVLSGGWAGRSAKLAEQYRGALAAAGMRSIMLGPDDVATPGVLDAGAIRLLVVPQGQVFPGEAVVLLDRFLKRRGHLMILGAPAFDRLVRQVQGPRGTEWLDDRQLADRLRRLPKTRTLLQMEALQKTSWQRSSNDLAAPTSWSMERENGIGPVLRHDIRGLSGWDTLEAKLDQPAAEGDNVILFRARGQGPTSALAVELRERDGSRWIAVVPLTDRWQTYALTTSEFKLWDPDRTSGRGAHGDHVNLQAISAVSVGLAFTHTSVPGGNHTYWFADLGSARGPEVRSFAVPVLDTISPEYKLYPVRGAKRVDGSLGRPLVGAQAPALPRNVLSTHPRPTGTGFDKQRKYRWIPLLQVTGEPGVMGTIATLVHHLQGPYAGGRWASFTVPDTDWYARPDVVRYVVAVAKRMLNPVLLAEAGTQYYGYFPDERPVLGARATHASMAGLTVRFVVKELQYGSSPSTPKVLFQRSAKLQRQGEDVVARVTWTPRRLWASRYRVTATLLENGKAVDVLEHEITVRHPLGAPGAAGRPKWRVTVEEGQFSADGKPWYPHGVNYMPSSGIAAEDGHYFEQWLSSESYDPVVIERDLSRVRYIGFNMVSAFIYTESTHNHNLVDFLNRCDAHGLRVNLSLRPGTPLDFQWPDIGEIIEVNRLADDTTVFAYDLAWEPAWGYRDQRRRWDAEWREWIRQRYGSIENAEKDWGERAPRENGEVVGPWDADVTASSTIPHVVAAYRRFQDDYLSRKHMEARQKIRTLDKFHLLSFRMSIAGDPTCGPAIMPYDFMGLARSMDFMAPEGYGRIGDKERVKPGWFTVAYARYAAPSKPVLWAEFGYSLWNKGAPPATPKGLSFADAFDRRHYLPGTIAFTEQFYRDFYEMALASESAGTVCWWYPGGFRVGENSDFGIINPDGTWRGLTHIIAEYGRKFANRPKPRYADATILIDRDKHPDGIYGIYNEVKDEFWRLVSEGHFPALVDEAEGTLSRTCPTTAVGNLPYNGSNPPKYLDAEFEYVRLRNITGAWIEVPYGGGEVRLKKKESVIIEVLPGNNGRVGWTSVGYPDCVGLRLSLGRAKSFIPLPSMTVPPMGTARPVSASFGDVQGIDEIVLQLEANGRCRFGEVRKIRVLPE